MQKISLVAIILGLLFVVHAVCSADIYEAAREGDVEKVRQYLDAGVDPNVVPVEEEFDFFPEEGFAPLHWAALEGHIEVAQLLLARGADVNVVAIGTTPLHLSVEYGHLEMVELLIEQGADIDAPGNAGLRPLHQAVESNDAEVVTILLEANADIEARDMYARTPLAAAASKGHTKITELLLDSGSDVNAVTDDGRTPLVMAVRNNHWETVTLLLERGATHSIHTAAGVGDVSEIERHLAAGVDVNARIEWSAETPLHWAARSGEAKAVRSLLEEGADARGETNWSATPLHMAAAGGHVETAELLVGAGAEVDAKTDNATTPLHEASLNGRLEMAEFLLDSGADVTATHEYNRTALYDAAFGGHAEIAELLLDHGADVNARTDEGDTALHVALPYPVLVQVLLERSADVNAADGRDRMPLHEAAQDGHLEAAELLLDNGAAVEAKDHLGRTPLHCTAGMSFVESLFLWATEEADGEEDEGDPILNAARLEIARLLVERGAEVNAKDDDGMTPLQLAIEADRTALADLLREHGFDEDLAGRLQAALEDAVGSRESKFPGALLYVSSSELGTWTGAAGLGDIETDTATRADDRFRAGSIMKTFVAVVVLQLVEEGRFSLDDALPAVLPEAIAAKFAESDKITVRMLLNHTAGVADWLTDTVYAEIAADFSRVWEDEEFLDVAAAEEPYFAPGEGWAYSNTDYTLLGLVIEQATGRPWREEVRERVIEPLHLENTLLPQPGDPSIPGNHARGYMDMNGEVVDVTAVDPSMAGAAGGSALVTTTADLARFLGAVLAGGLFRNAGTLKEMLTFADVPDEGGEPGSGGVGYGLGIMKCVLPGGIEMLGHEGGTAGYSAFVFYLPAQAITVAGAMNHMASTRNQILFPALEILVPEFAPAPQ